MFFSSALCGLTQERAFSPCCLLHVGNEIGDGGATAFANAFFVQHDSSPLEYQLYAFLRAGGSPPVFFVFPTHALVISAFFSTAELFHRFMFIYHVWRKHQINKLGTDVLVVFAPFYAFCFCAIRGSCHLLEFLGGEYVKSALKKTTTRARRPQRGFVSDRSWRPWTLPGENPVSIFLMGFCYFRSICRGCFQLTRFAMIFLSLSIAPMLMSNFLI